MSAGDSGLDDTRRPGEPRGGAAVPRRKPTGRAPGEPRNVAWLYLLPGVAFFGLFTLRAAPALGLALVLRLGRADVERFVGFDNYRTAFSDPDVRARVPALRQARHLLRGRAGRARPDPRGRS